MDLVSIDEAAFQAAPSLTAVRRPAVAPKRAQAPKRFLFTTFEGGGHVPPALLVAAALRRAGHEVLFVSDEANRQAATTVGLAFAPWETAPNRQTLGDRADPLRDWKPRLPHAIVREVCQGVMTGPAARYADDTLRLISRFDPDVIVSNELLLGVMAAGEARGVPVALLTANVWCYPTRQDVPPFGPGFSPWPTPAGQRRDEMVRGMISGWYDAGLEDLNRARHRLGLKPLARCLDQLEHCAAVLLGVSQAFDYGVIEPPPGFLYVGPLGQVPDWVGDRDEDLDLLASDRPNVLVSFSTTHQDQAGAVKRCIRALAGLEVNAIVTLGPALSARGLPSAPNIKVVARANHDVLVPHCDLIVCHGGHGTVVRPLVHGKPVICLPSGRDQPDNAQRIATAGAGLRLSRHASVGKIRRAARRVLGDPAYARSAAVLGALVRQDSVGADKAVSALEAIAVPNLESAHRRTA